MLRQLEDYELNALKGKAAELDIRRGGHCDWRSGAVNLWSSPENCPEGQENLVYLKGAIGYPRNFIGTVFFADLSMGTYNYERARQETGKLSPYGEDRVPYENASEDITWVREQWQALWHKAMPGTQCPELFLKEAQDAS